MAKKSAYKGRGASTVRQDKQCRITLDYTDGTKEQFDSSFAFAQAAQSRVFKDADLTIEGLKLIPNYFCENQPGIKSLTLGNGVYSIGMAAFLGCSGIKTIHFSDTVASIGQYAFARNYSLKSVEFPKGMRHIGDGAFFGCTSLCSISLSKSLYSIGPLAFAYCRNLHNVSSNLSAACIIHKSAFHQSLSDCVVCSQIGRIALKDIPALNSFSAGTAQNRYYVEKKNPWEKSRLARQLAYRGISFTSETED